MRRAPFVPTKLEEAICQLAAQFPTRVRLNVVSEPDQLHVQVLVQYGQALLWSVDDCLFPVDHIAQRIEAIARTKNTMDSTLLFTWDPEAMRLTKRKLGLQTDLQVHGAGASASNDG